MNIILNDIELDDIDELTFFAEQAKGVVRDVEKINSNLAHNAVISEFKFSYEYKNQ